MAHERMTFRTWIRATPEAIWSALTDPAENGRYGYCVPAQIDLRPGGAYVCTAPPEWAAHGMTGVLIDGEVREASAPDRLVMTWHPMFSPEMTAEEPATLTYEITPLRDGVTLVTLVHEAPASPLCAAMVSGDEPSSGGGWAWVLSDLKTLLETGSSLPTQMG